MPDRIGLINKKVNVTQLSKAIGFEPENLLKQMSAAGLSHKSVTDEVNNEDKKTLLTFLKSQKDIKKNYFFKKGYITCKKGHINYSVKSKFI